MAARTNGPRWELEPRHGTGPVARGGRTVVPCRDPGQTPRRPAAPPASCPGGATRSCPGGATRVVPRRRHPRRAPAAPPARAPAAPTRVVPRRRPPASCPGGAHPRRAPAAPTRVVPLARRSHCCLWSSKIAPSSTPRGCSQRNADPGTAHGSERRRKGPKGSRATCHERRCCLRSSERPPGRGAGALCVGIAVWRVSGARAMRRGPCGAGHAAGSRPRRGGPPRGPCGAGNAARARSVPSSGGI